MIEGFARTQAQTRHPTGGGPHALTLADQEVEDRREVNRMNLAIF
jgi:hypothetical protein